MLADTCRARDETPGEPEQQAADRPDDLPKDKTVLRPREREVLGLMAEGFSSKQIGYKLHISIRTVETHRRNIAHKLKLHSVAELTKYAIREGLASLES